MAVNGHCKAAAKTVEAWARRELRPARSSPAPARAGLATGRRTLPSERDVHDLARLVTELRPGDGATQRLKQRFLELVTTLERVRQLEMLILEVNKTLSVDETMTPDFDCYKAFRKGLVPLEVMGTLARYEAHVVREIEAMALLLGLEAQSS